MTQLALYQWEEKIATRFESLTSWQIQRIADLTVGIVGSESVNQRQVALELKARGDASDRASIERRFQRFLADDKLNVTTTCREWIRWVWEALHFPNKLTLLVDETKLSDHLSIMMLGVAYENRCLPLAWHCYHAESYPRCGQVSLILNLLLQVKKALPDDVKALVLADRGIGTSPSLCRYIDELLEWHYLFRITSQCKIVTDDGEYTISQQVQEGDYWCASGKVFKKRGRIPAHARSIWENGYDECWALVTNDPNLTGHEYAQRNWQEQSFRDLKSGGWQWDHSHVWQADHARRLILLMTLAYGWAVALGAYVFATDQQARLKTYADGTQERRYSIFTEGLMFLKLMLRSQKPIRVYLCFDTLELTG